MAEQPKDQSKPTAVTASPARPRAKIISSTPGGKSDQTDWAKWLTNGLIVLAVVLIAYALVQRHRNSVTATAEQAKVGLTNARQALVAWQARSPYGSPPQQLAQTRELVASQVEDAVKFAQDNSQDPVLRAEALLLQGDLNFTIGNNPPLPGAATQPSLQLAQPVDAYLTSAASAYQQVLDLYASQPLAVANARFGLAAVLQDQKKWDDAKAQYAALSADARQLESLHRLADYQSKMIDQISKPLFIQPAPPATHPAGATTLPIGILAPPPSPLPATTMAAPSTQP